MSTPIPGLESLTDAQVARVRDIGHEVPVPAHWSLILESQPADTAYLLLAGRVVVRSRGMQVAELGPGNVIGEVGLVERRLRTATVTTLEPVTTLAFPRSDFAALRSEIPAFDALVSELAHERTDQNDARRRVDTVVLDVDGTLVDTVFEHVVAWTRAFAEVGVEVPAWRVHRSIGMGGDKLVAAVAGHAVEEAHGDHVRARHDELFDEVLPRIHALPGARDLLVALREGGLKVAVASSGNPEQTARLLDLVDGHDLSDERTTSQDADATKPEPDVVDIAVARVGGTRAVVVGDAVWDVEAARRRGDASIGLLTGGVSEHELLAAGADATYDDPQDLLDHLDESPLAP